MYLSVKEENLKDFSEESINDRYDHGFVFTRLDKGIIQQTRSLRIELKQFIESSENRRILKKTAGLDMIVHELPFVDYKWEIHKLGKDFYTRKFGDKVMSASKIKEMFTDVTKSNMNL